MNAAVIAVSDAPGTLGCGSNPNRKEPDMRKTLILLTTVGVAALAQATAGAGPPPPPPHHVLPPPSDFVARVDNPWFPLTPGTVLTSKGESDGTPVTDVFTVTHQTKTIKGVRATVIDDRVLTHGRVTERTSDWYAQDKAGNVWYLGEKTATYKADGSVESREGSWQAGVNGGIAGIFMPAHPKVGQSAEQEYYAGHAQDTFKILRFNVRVHTPGVSSRHAMLVQETTPLEPGVLDHKIYVRGVGTVREETVKGGNERLELVSVRRP
jgi:hypothetical protein